MLHCDVLFPHTWPIEYRQRCQLSRLFPKLAYFVYFCALHQKLRYRNVSSRLYGPQTAVAKIIKQNIFFANKTRKYINRTGRCTAIS